MPADTMFSLNELLGIFVAQATLVGFGIAGVRWVVKAEIADRLSRLEALEAGQDTCEKFRERTSREIGGVREFMRAHGRGHSDYGGDDGTSS